ncbi:MAG TPA: PhnD/SsuA/transferrin family substrate-binding protein [Candidatus Methylomirabilis sp.]|nr:PhnD/SsuA/transferrin family substrate-binding protein [Candidatus Methylomirabilis sp.]
MRRVRRGTAVGALLAGVLLSPGCDNSPTRVEVLSAPQGAGAVIKIASSDEAAPSFRKIADVFASRKGLRFEIIQTQSAEIPGLLSSGAVDAGVTAGGLPAGAGSSGFSYVPFAHDAIVFLASKDAGVGSLAAAQLRRIFKGEIADWSEVGGKRGPIRTVDRPEISTARRVLANGIFRGDFPSSGEGVVMQTNELAIQAMQHLPGFLGYGSMARVTTGRIPGVFLAVDGMQPLFTESREKGYPARVEYGLLFRKNSPGSVRELADFLLSREGWHELATQGLSPASKQLSMAACHCREREGTFDPSRDKSPLRGTFTLAVVPELGAIAQENRYAAITQQIADGLGVHARLLHLPSYRQVLTEFSEGRVDAAFVGSLVYGKLRRRMNVVPLVRPESGGVSHYRGVIVVRRGSGLGTFADLKGKRFACVPDTSAGDLYPRAMVSAGGGSWPGFFSGVVNVPSHQAAIGLVLSGAVDAAAVKDLVLKREQASSTVAREELVVLSTSGLFPENALVVSGSLGEKDRSALRAILLALDRENEGKEALRNLGADRMIPTTDEEYSAMYALARKTRYPLDGVE